MARLYGRTGRVTAHNDAYGFRPRRAVAIAKEGEGAGYDMSARFYPVLQERIPSVMFAGQHPHFIADVNQARATHAPAAPSLFVRLEYTPEARCARLAAPQDARGLTGGLATRIVRVLNCLARSPGWSRAASRAARRRGARREGVQGVQARREGARGERGLEPPGRLRTGLYIALHRETLLDPG
jgi:hypothetical protein